ncbi:MAG TPA: FAD-dependent oxidoreductase [Steroidobacteraceae bacterium]|nr:FAD-dependent oxidoreductase [Steroidobacteraceae bacterium]
MSGAACVIGAGQAGCELALELRRCGWSRPIVLIGEETHAPYQRPPLSKGYLGGQVARSALFLRQAAIYERSAIELRSGCRVDHIDRAGKTLQLSTGEVLRYACLALTTGGRPRKLSLADSAGVDAASNLLYLRTLDDADKLRARFIRGMRLVVVGGGYIGLETAAAGIAAGLRVTVLEAMPRVLARVTAPEVSSFYEDVHRAAGVDLRTNVAVRAFEMSGDGAVCAVHCGDGSQLPADLVVVGIGLIPNAELAGAAGLAVHNGIVVDECTRTTDPHIVAAGDCANQPWHDGNRVRLESVQNAIEQARAAAATLAGSPRPYRRTPWFWSEQYDLRLQMTGLSSGYDQVVLRGSQAHRSFALFYFKRSRLLACDAVNRTQEFMAAKRWIAEGSDLDPSLLADDSIPLASSARQ